MIILYVITWRDYDTQRKEMLRADCDFLIDIEKIGLECVKVDLCIMDSRARRPQHTHMSRHLKASSHFLFSFPYPLVGDIRVHEKHAACTEINACFARARIFKIASRTCVGTRNVTAFRRSSRIRAPPADSRLARGWTNRRSFTCRQDESSGAEAATR